MGWVRIHYLDTSAIVKLLVSEPYSRRIKSYFNCHTNFYTTSICFAEALGVLKVKYFYHSIINKETYYASCNYLTVLVKQHLVIDDIEISDSKVFNEVEQLADKYSIDIADSLQIYTIREGAFSRFRGESQPILITADKKLAMAVRAEGMKVWYIINESEPCYT
jgi:predicted nucleic acid-binding protein